MNSLLEMYAGKRGKNSRKEPVMTDHDAHERLKAEKARMEAALQPLVLKHVELEAENKRLRAELEQVREILSDRENEITRLRAFYNEAVSTIERLRELLQMSYPQHMAEIERLQAALERTAARIEKPNRCHPPCARCAEIARDARAALTGGKEVMSQEMALILLRSDQMTEADYVQRARENRWPPIK